MPFQHGNTSGQSNKRKHTVLSEKLRAAFVAGANKIWPKLLKAQFKAAEKDGRARQYIFDQVIGRPKETLEVEGGSVLQVDKMVMVQINNIYGAKQITGNGKAEGHN